MGSKKKIGEPRSPTFGPGSMPLTSKDKIRYADFLPARQAVDWANTKLTQF